VCLNVSAQFKEAPIIQNYLEDKFESDAPGISVLIAQKNTIVFQQGYGLADLDHKTPIIPQSVFRLGSVSKQFTAISILQLVEKNKLSLDDEIQKFIPDYPNDGYGIQIKHLLSHTSGIPDYLQMDHPDPFVLRRDFTPKEIIDFFKEQPLEFDPGTQFSYSNSGYIILGYIIEKISGKSYAQYVNDYLFTPSQMNNSYYETYQTIMPNKARGYSKEDNEYINSEFFNMSIPYAAGALRSTTQDLLKWHMTLRQETIISNEQLQKAITPFQLKDGTYAPCGYGWFLNNTIGGYPTIEHSGNISGFQTAAVYIPETDLYIVVLANKDSQPLIATSTAYDLGKLALGQSLNQSTQVDESIVNTYLGNYETKRGKKTRILNVSLESGTLLITEKRSFRTILEPITSTLYRAEGVVPEAKIEFVLNTENEAIQLIATQDGTTFVWNKVK